MFSPASVRRLARAGSPVLALVVAACGGGADSSLASGGAPSEPLPTLPPAVERFPEAFDADGCPVEAPDPCLSTAAEADQQAAQPGAGPAVERQLLGFSGFGWIDEPLSGAVSVLPESIGTVTDEGTWSAQGLVRNETLAAVDGVEVIATLLDGSGALLGTARASVVPTPLRSGEPGPFVVTSEIPATDVASVRWETLVGSTTDPEQRRSHADTVAWTRPFDGQEPVDTYLHRDPPGPRPYVLFGSVENLADGAPGADVAIAWQASDGRVLHVEVVEASCITGDLPADGTCDFLVAVAGRGHALDDARVTVWSWSP